MRSTEMADIERDLGRLEGRVEKMDNDIDDLKRMVQDMHQTITEAKGGWKTLIAVGTLSAGVTTMVLKLVGWLKGL